MFGLPISFTSFTLAFFELTKRHSYIPSSLSQSRRLILTAFGVANAITLSVIDEVTQWHSFRQREGGSYEGRFLFYPFWNYPNYPLFVNCHSSPNLIASTIQITLIPSTSPLLHLPPQHLPSHAIPLQKSPRDRSYKRHRRSPGLPLRARRQFRHRRRPAKRPPRGLRPQTRQGEVQRGAVRYHGN